jgi:Tfp pilus assembly protein PilE
VKCHACRQDNAANALFCTACRRPLVAPTALPSRIEPLATPSVSSGAAAMAATPSGFGGDRGTAPSRDRYAPPNATGAGSGRADADPAVLTEEEAWAAVVGESKEDYYLPRFDRAASGQSASWHWPAFFVTWWWMLYRKMWIPALIYFFAPSLVMGVLTAAIPSAGPLLGWLVILIVPAIFANRWYYRHCTNKIAQVRARGGSKEQMLARLEAVGGTSNVALIVLLVLIIPIIGILAAVALPAYQMYTVKAKVSDALPVANDVAAAVGKQFEQTGALPSGDDLNRMLADAPHHSRYVSGVALDGTSGVLKVQINIPPSITGTLLMTPSADNNRHLSWTCSTTDLAKYTPRSCR